MKKRIYGILAGVLCCFLVLGLLGCSTDMNVEGEEWYLGQVLTSDILRDPVATHISDKVLSLYGGDESLPRVDCTLVAKTAFLSSSQGKLVLTDNESGESYEGSFADREEYSPEATGYSITLGGKSGTALLQQFMDGNGEITRSLAVTLGKTILVFYPVGD